MFRFKNEKEIDENAKNEIVNKLCLGIDFGTTNSCISVWYKNKAIVIPDIDGNDVIPTVIEIKNNKKKIGKEAYIRKDIFDNKDTFLVYEIKKILGKKFSELTESYINMLGFKLCGDDNDNIFIIDSGINNDENNKENNKYYHPEEIATHLFISFKTRAEIFLSKYFNAEVNIKDIVLSVPANFNKNQRITIKQCAENAGFIVKRMINEPTAAAICYGIGKTEKKGINILVYDFGGGTLDISILNISDSVYNVLGSCGNSNLGGMDFDKKIMEYCIREFIREHYIDKEKTLSSKYEKVVLLKEKEKQDDEIDKILDNIMKNNQLNLQKLKFLSEQAKIKLTNESCVKIIINNFYEDKDLIVNLTREIFCNICKNLIWLFVNPLNNILETYSLSKNDIDEIIMVGGMTKVPFVRHNVELFMNKSVNCSINPDNVVSIGCAIHGYMINNNIDISDKLLLVDRTSLSIGVELSQGVFDPVIPRGTMIPAKKTRKYTTDTDNIEFINIKIYEGERQFVKDNMIIGDFKLSGIEKQKKGIQRISVEFNVDIDGIITVNAIDLENTINKNSICITNNRQNLSKEEIDEIITNAKLMDEIDKIEKKKKESHILLINNSTRILENVQSSNLKIPENIKEDIISNVSEILQWLKEKNYNDISLEKYKELIKDYKQNYSIYLIINEEKVFNELDSNVDNDKNGVEIIDSEVRDKFKNEIDFLKNVLNDCDNIHKELGIIKCMDIEERNKIGDFDEDKFQEIEKSFTEIYDKISNDILISIFINENLEKKELNEIILSVNDLYENFKEKFSVFNEEFNFINKLIKNINHKEDFILTRMENCTDQIYFYHNILTEQLSDLSLLIENKEKNDKENKEKEEEEENKINTFDIVDNEEINMNDMVININNMVNKSKKIRDNNKNEENKKEFINEIINMEKDIKMNENLILIKNEEINTMKEKLNMVNKIEGNIYAMKSNFIKIKFEKIKYFLRMIDEL